MIDSGCSRLFTNNCIFYGTNQRTSQNKSEQFEMSKMEKIVKIPQNLKISKENEVMFKTNIT